MFKEGAGHYPPRHVPPRARTAQAAQDRFEGVYGHISANWVQLYRNFDSLGIRADLGEFRPQYWAETSSAQTGHNWTQTAQTCLYVSLECLELM